MSQPDAEIDREKAQLGPSADGTVMLDLGGDIGALVLHTGPELHLAEIDISRVDGARPLAEGYELPHQHGHGEHSHGDDHGHSHGDHGHSHGDHGHSHGGAADGVLRTHVAVRERRGPAGVRYAAIYAGLLTGAYQLWNLDGTPADVVTIVGGQVTELHW